MNTFTLDELRQIMRSSAGIAEEVDLDGDIAEIEFAELGYDSLAVLEFAGQVERRYGIPMPDDAVGHMRTPAAAVEYVNAQLAKAGV